MKHFINTQSQCDKSPRSHCAISLLFSLRIFHNDFLLVFHSDFHCDFVLVEMSQYFSVFIRQNVSHEKKNR
jgi:hypothetical protein